MAVKVSEFTREAGLEIKILCLLINKKIGTAYFGCQYTLDEENVIIIQQKSDADLSDKYLKAKLLKLSPLKRMLHYQYIFEQVIALFKMGFIINDIKLENMVYNEREDKIKIIDFELGQKVG